MKAEVISIGTELLMGELNRHQCRVHRFPDCLPWA